MKLRTFEGEPGRGELTTGSAVCQDRLPVLLANDEPSPVRFENSFGGRPCGLPPAYQKERK